MTTAPTSRDRLRKALDERGLMRLADLKAFGVTATTVRRMQDAGEVVKLGRGLYQAPDADYTSNHAARRSCPTNPEWRDLSGVRPRLSRPDRSTALQGLDGDRT